ncbi:MAG: thioredoxin family protein [Clostridia bacterium]|nr:thioredoxin family protein [Clostridia bacterium]
MFVIGAVIGFASAPQQGKYGQIISGNPTLIDIGSTSCVPCQQLQPVLVSLGSEYDGVINIEFYDCWNTTEGAEMATRYNAETIPTLIFLDGNGNVVARMTGYNEQSVIEAKFRSLGWIE